MKIRIDIDNVLTDTSETMKEYIYKLIEMRENIWNLYYKK